MSGDTGSDHDSAQGHWLTREAVKTLRQGRRKADGITQLVGWAARTATGPQGSGAGDMADLPTVRELLLSGR